MYRFDGGGLLDRMAGMPDTHARIAVLENHILSKFGCSMGVDPYVQHCVKVIESGHGIVPMHILEKGTGIGARQIERKFMRDIGIGPKAYSRIVRFLSIIQHAKTAARPDWSGLAATHAYSDQSHLVREFKEFSGLTPSAFIAPQ